MTKTVRIFSMATGLIVAAGCASHLEKKEISFAQMPPAAQQSVRDEIGDKAITRVDLGSYKNEETAYRVETERVPGSLAHPILWVTPSGQILKESSLLTSKGYIYEPAGAEMSPSTRTDPDYFSK